MRFGRVRGMVTPRAAWFDRLTTNGRLGGMRGVMGVAALAAGLLLAVAAMPSCSLGCPTPEERTYLDSVVDWAERTLALRKDSVPILREGGARPELILNEGWQRRVKRVLDELISAQEAIIDVEVPSSRAEESHRAVVRIAEVYIEATELLWQGVLDVDAETILRGLDKYDEVPPLLEEATAAGERFCE